MKKLMLLATALCMIVFCRCSSKAALTSTERISLNGISYDDANKMIKKFQAPTANWSYSSPTTYWLSKEQIDTIDTLLHKENADGIRIYLARDTVKPINTFVIVSTRYDGVTGGWPVHTDYFNHPLNLLSKGVDEDGGDGGGATLNTLLKCTDPGCEINQAFHITCDDAIAWVQNTSNDKIGSKAEWFDLCVIDYLNDELHKYTNSDGIRIYLSRSKKDDWHKVIMTTTEPYNTKYHKDYYKCYATSKCKVPITENGELCPTHCHGTTVPQN